jgi:hypothetical protein
LPDEQRNFSSLDDGASGKIGFVARSAVWRFGSRLLCSFNFMGARTTAVVSIVFAFARVVSAQTASPIKILFVGNSFTQGGSEPAASYNNSAITDLNGTSIGGVPGIFKKMVDQSGLNYDVNVEAVGGQTLKFHIDYKSAIIADPKWNTVVLQDYSTRPCPPDKEGDPAEFNASVTSLKNLIQTGSGANIYLYETWSRPNLTFPVGSPYYGQGLQAMQTDLHAGYYNANNTNRLGGVAPVGDAFLRAVNEGVANPTPYNQAPSGTMNLWDLDNYHANRGGSYLAAAVLFGRITGADPRNLPVGPGSAAEGMSLQPSDAARLNLVAYEATTTPVGVWGVNGDGNWSTPGNWNPGNVPAGANAVVDLGTIITAAHTVVMDSPQTVGAIDFSSPNGYSITGGSTLTLDVTAGAASITVTAGSHNIAAPVALNDNLAMTSSGGTGVSLTGGLTATGKTIIKTGAGTAQLDNLRAAGLTISAGTVAISSKGTPNSPAGASVLRELNIAAGASLDLTNNAAVIDYTGPAGTLLADVRQHLLAGRLTSSASTGARRLGYGDNANLKKSTFAGHSVDASSVLIAFTYIGDANLDGQVDVTDLGALAENWQASAMWTGGDFNYDGFVDISDLGMLASEWQRGVGAFVGLTSFESALAAVGLGTTAIPEPACLGAFVIVAVLLLHRRPSMAHM